MALMVYKKKLDYSYTFGIYPTIEVLHKFPEKVKTVLLHPKTDDSEGVAYIKQLCDKHDINYDYSPKAITKVARRSHTMAVAVFAKYKTAIDPNKNHLMLVNPSDHGNMGTIIRAMLGFGVKDLAIIRPAVDAFDPAVIRSTMGALFDINFEYFDTYRQYADKFKNHTQYPFVLGAKNDLEKTIFNKPATLIFGAEGSGLPEFYEKMPNTVKIRHSEDIDSLNLSVAASIALYKLYNQG